MEPRHPFRLSVAIAAIWLAGALPAEEPTGEQIFQQLCASCHGASGQGTDDYPDALVGDKSIAQLARLIDETMPEGEPEKCTGEDAQKVAAYIYDAFYSPMAQVRNKPVRIEFSRLTVRQYENAVADLLGSFGSPGEWNDERGLEGEYYKNRRRRREERQIERRDPQVDFQFGESSPDPEKIEVEEFAIEWEGSVLAPETGDYEFIVETENGMRLWVNDLDEPLIDVRVRSGDETVYRKSLRLLGGRAYSLRLEFFKSKPEKTASVKLKWRRPEHTPEVIPERYLSPNRASKVSVVETPFPPDDSSVGYERGTSVSKQWAQATTYAAIEVAGKVIADLRELASLGDGTDREERLRTFCYQFAERAFRRPLTDEQKKFFVDQQFEDAPTAEAAVKRVVLLVLKSPRFLYRETGLGAFDDYAVASWLSFGLWDSIPDQTLLEAAAKGELSTREQIAPHAQRMVDDLRTRAKVRGFLHQWLNFSRFHNLSKDPELYPEFNEQIASDLRESLDLFLDEVIWSESSDFRQLLLSDALYLNGRLAAFYGATLPADAPFQKVSLDTNVRAGILSHPYLMSGLAYYATSSPIHRGVFLSRSLLGRFLKPPPEAVSPLAPDLHPDLTTRERTILQTSSAACQTCHTLINGLGFSLERFDAVGRYRTEEKGKPIDATASYLSRSGESVRFDGARELAAFLVESEETHGAFAEQLFQYLTKQPVQAFGPDKLNQLRNSFVEGEFNVQRLVAGIVTQSALAAKELNK
jgi:hypothetical protein